MNMIEGQMMGIPLIVLDGDLDHSSKQAVRDAVEDIFYGPYPPKSLIFDLTDCAFVDSGGLSVLLFVLGQLPADGWLGIIGPSTGTARALKYTGFIATDKVRFFSSRNEAAATLAREKRLLEPTER